MAQRARGRLRRGPHGGVQGRPARRACSTTRLLGAYTVDGKVVLVPHTADVTNVLWYNVPLLAEHGVTPPTTWDELLAACDTLDRRGHHPHHDRQQGPVGGRQLAQPPRVAGRGRGASTTDTLSGTGHVRHARVGDGLRLHQAARRRTSASTRAPTRSTTTPAPSCSSRARPPCTRSARGSCRGPSTRHRSSTSTSSTCRPCRRAAGDQDSVIGVETGYMVNAKSAKIDLAVEFLALLNSPENVQKLDRRGRDHAAAAASAASGSDIDARSADLTELLNERTGDRAAARHRLRPQDGQRAVRGHAAVLGGQSTPADALAALDRKLGR